LNIEPVGVVRKLSGEESLITVFDPYRQALHGIGSGDRLEVLYWMHELHPDQRNMLQVHPRGDKSRPLKGVFGVRSPMRPNPIGVSSVCVERVEEGQLLVTGLDALDRSPVIDIKAKTGDTPNPLT